MSAIGVAALNMFSGGKLGASMRFLCSDAGVIPAKFL